MDRNNEKNTYRRHGNEDLQSFNSADFGRIKTNSGSNKFVLSAKQYNPLELKGG